MPLIIFLVECGLELIPSQIKSHPAIKKNMIKNDYASTLLDNAIHHSAMIKLENKEKRGRPDIIHNCLLHALGSPCSKKGLLSFYVHTIQDRIFHFHPNVKINRNYNRFKGLMAKLLMDGQISFEGKNLISEINKPLGNFIRSIKRKDIKLFSSRGELIQHHLTIFPKNSSKNEVVIIGGFQKGFFSPKILDLGKKLISISRYPLDASIVVNKIINFYEIVNEII
jgi:rRNA small subunit pseudouridine methyltransferase Nep1